VKDVGFTRGFKPVTVHMSDGRMGYIKDDGGQLVVGCFGERADVRIRGWRPETLPQLAAHLIRKADGPD
jgi:hypothetical protein